ncbi:MAG: hypothetical protein ACREJC_03665 [Tepidisphaeraceae bacterium]
MSIRKMSVAMLCAGLGFCGCVRRGNIAPDQTNPTPLVVDQAMELRNWEQSQAMYENMTVIAGPTGFLYEGPPDGHNYSYAVLDVGIFLGNICLMPYAYCLTPPWGAVEYRGITMPPTYTAQPVLPPGIEVPEAPVPMEPFPTTQPTGS